MLLKEKRLFQLQLKILSVDYIVMVLKINVSPVIRKQSPEIILKLVIYSVKNTVARSNYLIYDQYAVCVINQ